MDSLRIKAAFSPNPRLEPLLDGAVRVPGVEIQWKFGQPPDLHLAHLTENAFDLFEFSLSNYLIIRDRPEERERLRWMAIPIFLSKAIFWLDFYVRVDSGIKSLADLRGKRIAVPDYHMTAAVWMRIVLEKLYGIRAEDVAWFNYRPPGVSHGKDVGRTLAPGIRITQAANTGEFVEKLRRGEIDGAYADGTTKGTLTGADRMRPLFGPGEGAEIIAEFRRVTGMTPVNHVLIAQRELIDRDPEMAMRIYEAFEASKREAYERARRFAAGYFVFPKEVFAREAAVFGEDPFPSGLAANRTMLETLAGTSLREGLIGAPPDIDALFCEATRQT